MEATEQLIVNDASVGIPLRDGKLIISTGALPGSHGGRDLYISSEPIPIDKKPTAKAGPDKSIRAGVTAQLDGGASFDDNTPTASLQFAWSFTSRPANSQANLIDADKEMASFMADVPGTYKVQLIVTDNVGQKSDPDEVVFSDNNLAPTAVAGSDQLVIMPGVALLDGRGSTDPENEMLTYAWTLQSQPANSSATLSGATTATPTLTPDVVGEYRVRLVVSDSVGPSKPNEMVITATTANLYAKGKILEADQIVRDLLPGQVTNKGNQTAFLKFLSNAIRKIDQGDIADAKNELEKAIRRADGCFLRGAPDAQGGDRDWITDCTQQIQVYNLLNDAYDAL